MRMVHVIAGWRDRSRAADGTWLLFRFLSGADFLDIKCHSAIPDRDALGVRYIAAGNLSTDLVAFRPRCTRVRVGDRECHSPDQAY